MLDVKKLLAKVLKSLQGMELKYYDNYTGTLLSATSSAPWTAPASGIMVMQMSTGGTSNGYWYVIDVTASRGVARLVKIGSPNWWASTSFPVIKGHKYRSESSNVANNFAHLYTITG